jgi:hypothetical protein
VRVRRWRGMGGKGGGVGAGTCWGGITMLKIGQERAARGVVSGKRG